MRAELDSSDEARSVLRSVLPIVMRRTAANTTSMAIDSRGIKNIETGGRSSRSRSAVTTASAITETNPWRDATAADIGPADCAELTGPSERNQICCVAVRGYQVEAATVPVVWTASGEE